MCTAAQIANGQQFFSPGRHKIGFVSSYDSTRQGAYLIVPERKARAFPVIVALHTWSANMEQRDIYSGLEHLAYDRGWLYLFPDFRGPNDHPLACGSDAACRDVVDALDWTVAHFPVDTNRVYLAGMSGGGHMAMLVASRYPSRWTAVSAWVGISDLGAWYDVHKNDRYGQDLRSCCGGPPTKSPAVSAAYKSRSSLWTLSNASGIPFDLAAGHSDGHGYNPVPIRQTVAAFNAIARALSKDTVTEKEILELSVRNGTLAAPLPSDTTQDPLFARRIFLRRFAGKSRITVFDGGHEWLPRAVIEWLGAHAGRGK